jgi:hypothetical protein
MADRKRLTSKTAAQGKVDDPAGIGRKGSYRLFKSPRGRRNGLEKCDPTRPSLRSGHPPLRGGIAAVPSRHSASPLPAEGRDRVGASPAFGFASPRLGAGSGEWLSRTTGSRKRLPSPSSAGAECAHPETIE